MIAFSVFVALIILLWALTMWALHIEFRAQRYCDRAKPESCRGPVVDHDYVAFWRSGAKAAPANSRGYASADLRHTGGPTRDSAAS